MKGIVETSTYMFSLFPKKISSKIREVKIRLKKKK